MATQFTHSFMSTPEARAGDVLRLEGVSRTFDGVRRVIDGFSLLVPPGARIGLLGENGAGKSTLLRIAAGADAPDAGSVAVPRRRGLRSAGLLAQEVRAPRHWSLRDLLEDALGEYRALERDLEAAALDLADGGDAAADRYAALLQEAETGGLWSIDARRDAVLSGLGLEGIPLERRIDEVSGGQRSRFALAALLLGRPVALMLDEPTNHLDDEAVAFLRGELRAWNGPVLFASHDRAFLDEVATGLVDIDPHRDGAQRYGGRADAGMYTAYLEHKAAEYRRWVERYNAEQQELARLREESGAAEVNIHRERVMKDRNKMAFGMRGDRAQQSNAARRLALERRIAELEALSLSRPVEPLRFAGIPTGSTPLEGGPLLEARDVRVDGRLRLAALDLEADARLLITGANGAGKSTLLSLLAGDFAPDAGTVQRRKGLRIALLEQDVRWPDPSRSPRDLYGRAVGEARAAALPLADLGLIHARDEDRPVGALSVGQQRRVALALIIARPPHLFLLDEPTNHLSLSLATELEDALGTYPGAVVVASHDRWLRRRWSGRTLHLEPHG